MGLSRVMNGRYFNWAALLRKPMRSPSATVETALGPVQPGLGALRPSNGRTYTGFTNDALCLPMELGVTK
eukprot:31018-Pyramimonas_sp.AAC.1